MTSQLNVDAIVDKSGNGGTNVKIGNTSTYVSDNGAVTQNTVQSLLKAYVCYTTSSTTAIHGSESFNHSSLTDNNTGSTKFTMTSAMSTSLFSLSDAGGDATSGYASWCDDNEFSTTTYEFNLGNSSFSSQDGPYHAGQVIGKLA
tara:strand:- start:251 stop:685 length:435 start_codon:yes stop_codon:yes gene_type:complete